MLFVKPILYLSVWILRFFSQQKNQHHFCLLGRSCNFLKWLHFNGDRKSHSLDLRMTFLWNVKSFPQWRGLWGVFREQVANNFNKQLPAEWMSPCRALHRHDLAAFGVWHGIPASSSSLMAVGSHQENRRPFRLSVLSLSLSSWPRRARIMQKISKTSLLLSESWIKTPALMECCWLCCFG